MNDLALENLFEDIHFSLLRNESKTCFDFKEILTAIEADHLKEFLNEQRKQEFLLGRLAANFAIQKTLKTNKIFIINQDASRAPIWPSDLIGSISHSDSLIIAVACKKDAYLSVGIDIEKKGRTRPEVGRFILTDLDIKSVDGISESDLLTLIFSAKESLYKALYPLVNKYFGFKAAALTKIMDNNFFEIQLIEDLDEHFCLGNRYKFTGKFLLDENNILTFIKITHTK